MKSYDIYGTDSVPPFLVNSPNTLPRLRHTYLHSTGEEGLKIKPNDRGKAKIK
ncbi:hypothetical protein PM082_021937 [Marasmius tenuissimus]|nr:hypothetical protein PM082_021937 [Marasmius tenuissimus]